MVTRLHKWLYFIKHLDDFQNIPEIFKDEIFSVAFKKAEIAKYSDEERSDYEESLKVFSDNKAVFDYAQNTPFDDGVMKGKKEIKSGMVEMMIIDGEPVEKNMKYTGFTKEEIETFWLNIRPKK